MGNFSILTPGQQINASATAGAAAVAFTQTQTVGVVTSDIMIYNPGPGIVYARAGASDVTADATCMPIAPGEKGAWSKGSATHLAAYSPSGAQVLSVFLGSGS